MKFKRVVFLVIFSLLFSIFFNTAAFADNIFQSNTDRYIVKFKTEGVDKNKLISKQNGKYKHQFKHINAAVADLSQQSLENLKNDPNVEYIEKDNVLKISSVQDNWGINDIGVPQSWQSGLTGKGVKIAIVDTGAGPHPDLVISGGVNTIYDSNTASYADDNGHGTHVTGIIAAQGKTGIVKGVAPESSVYAVKALDSSGSGYTSDIIAGIDWAIDNGMNLINMSLGSNESDMSLQNAVDTAYNKGLLVVAAAGNDGNAQGTGDSIDYPAKYSSVISVAAVDQTNTRAYFSSTGSKIEVSAPGVNVLSTYLNGGYAQMSGTSMATPFVIGDLALLKQEYPNYTNVQLKQLLLNNVKDLGATGKDSIYGYGLIKAPVKDSSVSTVLSYTYESQAKALYDLGLFKGVSESEYNPDLGAAMDRKTGIVMILRLVGKVDEAYSMSDSEADMVLSKYTDADKIKDWARKPVAYAVKNGLVLGITDTMVGPDEQITGKMFAAIILRNIGYPITTVNYDVSTAQMAEKGGLTLAQADLFNNKYLIRDDMVGMSYGALNLHYEATAKTIIETLIDEGKVDRAMAISLDLIN